MDTLMIGGIPKDDNDSVNKYKKAKEGMKRLGFTSYEEYMDYLDFINSKPRQKQKTLNVGQV